MCDIKSNIWYRFVQWGFFNKRKYQDDVALVSIQIFCASKIILWTNKVLSGTYDNRLVLDNNVMFI